MNLLTIHKQLMIFTDILRAVVQLAMSGLVLLVATWNCWITYKNGYAGLSALHLLPLLNPWLIIEM